MATLLRCVHITDTHLNPDLKYRRYATASSLACTQALMDAIHALPFQPDLILHTGDVVYDPDPEAYAIAKEKFADFSAPIIYLRGNHDDAAAIQRVLMERADDAIMPYLYYEQDINGVQVVILDSNGPAEDPTGNIPDEQLAWLDALVSANDDRPLLVAVHHNVMPVGAPWLDDWMRINNGEALHALFKKAGSRLRGVLFGHIHQNTINMIDGVMYVSAGSTWEQFFSYPMPENTEVNADISAQPSFNVVHITTEGIAIRTHQFSVASSEG